MKTDMKAYMLQGAALDATYNIYNDIKLMLLKCSPGQRFIIDTL